MRLLRVGLTVVLAMSAVVGLALSAGAQTAGPSITVTNGLDGLVNGQVEAGQRVSVTFDQFEARSATLSVCGNRAARGSGDCNMVESQGVRLRHMDVVLTQEMTITVPPFPCPCVIRAVGVETGEVAIAPIELVGHPVADVIDPNLGQPLVDVSISTAGASEGPIAWLRQSLGGPSPQIATVSVKNVTTEQISGATVYGSATRSGVSIADFDLTTSAIGPGQTWIGTARVELPPPAIGNYDWAVTASGAGPVVSAETSSQSIPWLLVLLILVLVWDLTAMVVRRVQRRRAHEKALSLARGEIDPDGVIDVRDRDLSDLPPPPTSAQDPTIVQETVGASSGPSAESPPQSS